MGTLKVMLVSSSPPILKSISNVYPMDHGDRLSADVVQTKDGTSSFQEH